MQRQGEGHADSPASATSGSDNQRRAVTAGKREAVQDTQNEHRQTFVIPHACRCQILHPHRPTYGQSIQLTLLWPVEGEDGPDVGGHVTARGRSVVASLVEDPEGVAGLSERSSTRRLLVLVRIPRELGRIPWDTRRRADGVGVAVLRAVRVDGERGRRDQDVGEGPAEGDVVVLEGKGRRGKGERTSERSSKKLGRQPSVRGKPLRGTLRDVQRRDGMMRGPRPAVTQVAVTLTEAIL